MRTDNGARVTCGSNLLCEVGRDEERHDRYSKAYGVARNVYGSDRRGRASATNSMVDDVLSEIERVAGC